MLFPRPVDDGELLQEGNLLMTEQIKPEFNEQVDALRARILDTPPKRLFGAQLSGKHVVDLARAMVATINEGDAMPSIKGAWEYVVDQSCEKLFVYGSCS